MEQPCAKQRKRDAVGNLRELAAELGVPNLYAHRDYNAQHPRHL